MKSESIHRGEEFSVRLDLLGVEGVLEEGFEFAVVLRIVTSEQVPLPLWAVQLQLGDHLSDLELDLLARFSEPRGARR